MNIEVNTYEEKEWQKKRKKKLWLKGGATVTFFILALIFALPTIGAPVHDKRTITLLYMFTICAALSIIFLVSFFQQLAIKNPYAQRLVFLSREGLKIGYSIYYSYSSNSTIAILLSGTIIAQISLTGHQDEDNVRRYLEQELFKDHGDLSKFPIYKNIAKESLQK